MNTDKVQSIMAKRSIKVVKIHRINPLGTTTHYDNIHTFLFLWPVIINQETLISSRFSINSETFASEMIENLEEIPSQYYMYSNILKNLTKELVFCSWSFNHLNIDHHILCITKQTNIILSSHITITSNCFLFTQDSLCIIDKISGVHRRLSQFFGCVTIAENWSWFWNWLSIFSIKYSDW